MPLVLIAGENPNIQLALRKSLESHAYGVVESESGAACLDAVSRHTPDVVLLDSDMQDSLTTCATLRVHYPDLPILMIVASDAGLIESAFDAGTTDILSIPIHETVLLHRVGRLYEIGEQAHLLQREAWSQSIIDNALEGIWRTTLDGKFLLVNPALVSMLGYESAEAVLALNVREDVHVTPEQRDQLIENYLHTSNDRIETEVIWKRKDGTRLIVRAHARAVRDGHDKIVYFEGQALDITERHTTLAALKQSEEELRTKTSSLESINAISDAVSHSLDVNTVMEHALTAVMDYLDVPGASIYLVNETADHLVRAATTGVSARLSSAAFMLPLQNSLNGQAVATHEIAISHNPDHDERIPETVRQALAAAQIKQIIVVPLLFQEQVIGTLSMPLSSPRDLTDQERVTLMSVGKTIGLGVAHAQHVAHVEAEVKERQRAEQAEHEQRLLAEALRDTAAALNSDLDQERVLERILTQMQRVIPCDTVNVMLIDNGTMYIVRAQGYSKLGISDDVLMNTRYVMDNIPNFRWMAEKGYGLAIPDVQNYPGWIVDDVTYWIASHVSAPIVIEGEVIGFLNLDSAEIDTFQQKDAETLKIFADQAGIAIRNARLYDAIRKHADILEQRVEERTSQLALERAKLQAILDGIADGVIGVIYDETITPDNFLSIRPSYRYINQSFYQMLGYSAEEMTQPSRTGEDVLGKQFLSSWVEFVNVLPETGFWYTEKQFQHRDGSLFDVSVRATSIKGNDGEFIGAITIFRDISQEKQLEQQKARFISNAAHELRTPITNLKTRLYLAQKQPERMGAHLQILEQVTDHIKDLTEHLLDLSRLERGILQLQRELFNLNSFIARVVEIQIQEAEKRDLQLVIRPTSEALIVHADHVRINQVITNLITNAINHTPSGGNITLSLERENDDEMSWAVIRVCDTGVGINPEHVPHIFQPFYQANKGGSHIGLGLGLSISKEIVDLHGGSLSVTSTVGEGTCFHVKLPLADAPAYD